MNIIFVLHVIIFFLAVIIPFIGEKRIIRLYSLFIPVLFFHWMTNDDTCALTQIEMLLTGNEKKETFFGRLIKPIYTIDDNDANNLVKTLFLFLWFVMQYRLGRLNIHEFLEN